MPLADHRRLIPRLLEQLRERLLASVEALRDEVRPVQVAVLPRQDRRPARRADRVGHERVAEQHPLARDPINVRRLVDLRPVRADRMGSVVVGHDEQDVGLLPSLCGPGRCGDEQRRDEQDAMCHAKVLSQPNYGR